MPKHHVSWLQLFPKGQAGKLSATQTMFGMMRCLVIQEIISRFNTVMPLQVAYPMGKNGSALVQIILDSFNPK